MLTALLASFPNIDPVAFSIGPFSVKWYALAYVAAIVFAVWYIKRLVRNERLWCGKLPAISTQQADDLFLWITLGVILGGRIGYVLFYKPIYYAGHPLESFALWQGGMSFHGGFLGVALACYIYGRKHGVGLDRLLDLGAAATPVGLGLGRLANFVNAELYGRPSDAPWAMVFPTDPLGAPRHPSQLYEAFLEGVVLFLAVRVATHHFKALAYPGRASAVFAIGYGLSRIVSEFFREPDQHIGYIGGQFTMGMLLSLPLIGIGIWLALRSRRKDDRIPA